MTQLAETFQSYRPLLFSIAYRMLSSASEAEDILQEAYLRYQAADTQQIQSPRSFLSTIVTRLCLDTLKSARAVREQYIGPWLPEPLLTESGDLVAQRAEQHESISMAFLILLERLTPQERAVFVLREVFEFPYQEIAEQLELSVANCRQLFQRAQQRLAAGQRRFQPSAEAHRRLVERFLRAAQQGDLQALTRLLSEDVVNYSDGGGKVSAARNPIIGPSNVARLILGGISKFLGDARVELREVNGSSALIIWSGSQLLSVSLYQIENDLISNIYLVMNPDKLAYLQAQLIS